MFRLFRNLFSAPQPSGPTEIIGRFGAGDTPIDRNVVTADGEAWRVAFDGEASVPLFELSLENVACCRLDYRATLRSEALDGAAYLEMWCRLGAGGEFFSKGLHHTIRGTTGWSEHEIPFHLKQGQWADRLRLNLAGKGKGFVWIRDVEVRMTPVSPGYSVY